MDILKISVNRLSSGDIEELQFLINDLDLIPSSFVTPCLAREYAIELQMRRNSLIGVHAELFDSYMKELQERFHNYRKRVKSDDSSLLHINFD